MTFSFAFGDPGDESSGALDLGLPFLGGEPRESVLGSVERAEGGAEFSLWRGPEGIGGWSRVK
ncbi:MAG TPA: hypothetical protein VKG78_03830, partial [Opitutaceae bacterium]|nr:hypothetical protein [Opitutaceae bacterium]